LEANANAFSSQLGLAESALVFEASFRRDILAGTDDFEAASIFRQHVQHPFANILANVPHDRREFAYFGASDVLLHMS
jgi:hypothetical protein